MRSLSTLAPVLALSLLLAASLDAGASVQQQCPALPASLQQDLAPVVHELAEEAEMQVRLTLRGSQIVQVQTDGGPLRYDRALRRALRWVRCSDDNEAERTVSFTLRLSDPWGRGPR